MTATNDQHYNLMMLSGDSSVARGIDGAFAQMLAHFAAYWQRIDILTPTAPDASARQLLPNVYVHPAPYHRALQALFIRRKGAELLQQRVYHLVASHDYGFFYNGLGAYWLLRQHNTPYVSEIHHVEGYPHAVTLRERLWRAAAQRYIPFAARHATAFRTVNREVSQTLREWGVPPEKICLLHSLYIDYDTFQPQALDKRYDILFVGRLASNKGILILLQAIQQVRQQHPAVQVAIRGDGPLRTQVEAFVEEHSLQQNVTLVPHLPDAAALAQLYNQSRMLVCASTVEGNPRVTVEAMACGIPVITTPVGIMPELATDGQDALFFQWDAAQLAQQIVPLLQDPKRALQIGEQGRAAASQFDAETIIQRYANAYHRLIQGQTCDKP